MRTWRGGPCPLQSWDAARNPPWPGHRAAGPGAPPAGLPGCTPSALNAIPPRGGPGHHVFHSLPLRKLKLKLAPGCQLLF